MLSTFFYTNLFNPHNVSNISNMINVGVNRKKLSENSHDQRSKNDLNLNHSTNIHDISNTIYLPPGVYYIIAWSKVDPSWGVENQGHGSTNPESYLANGRTNTEWISKQPENESKRNFVKRRNNFFSSSNSSNYNEFERKVEPKEEYERMRV